MKTQDLDGRRNSCSRDLLHGATLSYSLLGRDLFGIITHAHRPLQVRVAELVFSRMVGSGNPGVLRECGS